MRLQRRLAACASMVVTAIAVTPGSATGALCPTPPPSTCEGTECKVVWRKCERPTNGSSLDSPVGRAEGTVERVAHPPKLLYLPTCTGNGLPGGVSDLCIGATETCSDQGQTRYWVYVATWEIAAQRYTTPVLREDPPFVCLGPRELPDQVDPTVAVIAQVRSAWKTFELPRAEVVTQPAGETLVNAATRFTTTTPPTATLPPKPVLGMNVTLRVKATGYEWDFGDGSTVRVPATGSKPSVEHTYREPGRKEVRLRTLYGATFTIAGSPTVYPLEGTADVPGRPTQVVAREARSELVDR